MLRMLEKLIRPIVFSVIEDDDRNTSFAEMAEKGMAEDQGNETDEGSSEPQEDVSQEVTPEQGAEKEDDLDKDEEFQKEAKEMAKEMGKNLSFNQLKRFKQIYRKMKDAERNLQSKKGVDELDDDELAEALKARGIELQQATPPPAQADAKESKQQSEFDEKRYQELYLNASPEQRQWLDLIRNISKMENSDIKKELAQYRDRFGELSMSQVESKLNKLEEEARTLVKDKYKLDWEKDVLPDVRKLAQGLVRSLPKGVSLADVGWNALTLAKQVIADKGYEVAKVQAQKDSVKEKQKLKQANLEMGSEEMTSEPNPNMDMSEMLQEEMQKAGMTRFV